MPGTEGMAVIGDGHSIASLKSAKLHSCVCVCETNPGFPMSIAWAMGSLLLTSARKDSSPPDGWWKVQSTNNATRNTAKSVDSSWLGKMMEHVYN